MQAKICKKALSLLLALAMLCGLLVTTAFAADGDSAAYTVSSATAAPGDTVQVTVTLDNQLSKGFYEGNYHITFDSEYLTFQEATLGSAVSEKWTLSVSTPEISIQYRAGSTGGPMYASGTVLELTFLVSEDAPDGDYEIGIDQYIIDLGFIVIENEWFTDNSANDLGVTPTINAGKITVGNGSSGKEALTESNFTGPSEDYFTAAGIEVTPSEDDLSFTVACDNACVVAVDNGDGTYTPLTGTAVEGGYQFTAASAGDNIVVALKGDADGDGTITITDYTAIARALLESDNSRYQALDTLSALVGDADGDGTITITDYTTIARALLESDNSRYAAIAW